MIISDGRGTCYGDSGGPAIVKQPDGSYVQVPHYDFYLPYDHDDCNIVMLFTIHLIMIEEIMKQSSVQFQAPSLSTISTISKYLNSVFRLEFSLSGHWLAARRVIPADRSSLLIFHLISSWSIGNPLMI